MSTASVVITLLFACALLTMLAGVLTRGGESRSTGAGEDSDEGGGGGGSVRRRPPRPEDPSSSGEPPWWPRFERELEEWAAARRARASSAEYPRQPVGR